MKDRIFGVLQRIGRSFMLPIALLPVAGLLLGIGSSFTNPTTLETYGLTGVIHEGGVLYTIFDIMSKTGSVVFDNLALLFAMGVAIGMAKKEKEAAALSGAIGYLIMNAAISALISAKGGAQAMPANSLTSVLGITTLQMGVFGGIIVGLGVAALGFAVVGEPGFIQQIFIIAAKALERVVRPLGHFFILRLLILEEKADVGIRKSVGTKLDFLADDLIAEIEKERVVAHATQQTKQLLRGRVAKDEHRQETVRQRLHPGFHRVAGHLGAGRRSGRKEVFLTTAGAEFLPRYALIAQDGGFFEFQKPERVLDATCTVFFTHHGWSLLCHPG